MEISRKINESAAAAGSIKRVEMALQSDSKEMGKVKLHMLIGDSDSQFSIHIQGCLMPKNGQGLTKESGRCLI